MFVMTVFLSFGAAGSRFRRHPALKAIASGHKPRQQNLISRTPKKLVHLILATIKTTLAHFSGGLQIFDCLLEDCDRKIRSKSIISQ